MPAETPITLTNCKDLTRLRQLKNDDVVLITDPELSRGIDYRAAEGTVGIALLVMSSVQSQRAFIQLLGRVGRYREPCKRFLWNELDDTVCPFLSALLLNKLKQGKTVKRHTKRKDKDLKGQQKLPFSSKQ